MELAIPGSSKPAPSIEELIDLRMRASPFEWVSLSVRYDETLAASPELRTSVKVCGNTLGPTNPSGGGTVPSPAFDD